MGDGVGLPRPHAANLSFDKFAFPLRFLGFGLYWAWMTTFWTGWARSPLGMPTIGQATTARIAVQTATALGFLVAVLFARRLMSFSGQRLLVLGGAVLGPLGTIVATLGHNQTNGGAPVYLVLAWASLGVSCACITLLWGQFYASVGLKRASLYTPLSLVLAVMAGFVLSSMQPVAAAVLTTLLPLLSVGMFMLVAPEVSQSPEQVTLDRRQPVGVLWRIVLAIGVYGTTLGFYLQSYARVGQGSPSPMTGRLVALAVPLVTIVLLQKNKFSVIFRITLPLTAAGFLLLPLLGTDASWIGVTIIAAGGTFFDIFTWIALSEIAHRRGLSPIRVFGLGRAANAGGIALGWMGSYVLLGTTSVHASPVLDFSVAMVFILILTTTLILREGDFPSEKVVLAASPADDPGLPAAETRSTAGRWRQCCARIARERELSPREEEVMVLLAKGHSSKHIEEALVISYHTAKSHVNHVYRKLDVHSREELIDLVERQKQPGLASGTGSSAGAGAADDTPGGHRENTVAAHLYRSSAR